VAADEIFVLVLIFMCAVAVAMLEIRSRRRQRAVSAEAPALPSEMDVIEEDAAAEVTPAANRRKRRDR
jgi:hypothetical protein